MAQRVPSITLNNGVQMPQLGFGVFQIPQEDVAEAVLAALGAGYRSIDTAAGYQNEGGVGDAILNGGIPREELFVTTKLANDRHGYDSTLEAFDESIAKLKLDYVDLYLIHWPLPAKDAFVGTWKAFEKLHADGRVRSIGVSNFQIPHLRRLLGETDVVPVVNQVELHPTMQQLELRTFNTEQQIVTEAWSPLAQGAALKDPVVTGLAEKYGKTPAQIVLRWHIELGNVVIPKSVTPARIKENIDIFDFELSPDDVDSIAELETGTRIGPDPDEMGS